MTDASDRYDLIARQLLLEARGKRSQLAFSRRLGFKSNTVARWESGARYPTAEVALRAMRLGGLAVDEALATVHPRRLGPDVNTDDEVAAWLRDLVGARTQQEIAERAGVSPSVVSRWLSGATRLRLPDLLRCIDVLTGILSTFVHRLAGLEAAPAAAPAAPDRVRNAAEVVLDYPMASFVNILLRSDAYKRLPTHLPGWLADHAGTDVATIQATLEVMEAAGFAVREGDHYVSATPAGLAHFRPSKEQVTKLRTEQMTALAQRTLTGAPIGPDDSFTFMHLVCTQDDFVHIKQILQEAFSEARRYASNLDGPAPEADMRAFVVCQDLITLG